VKTASLNNQRLRTGCPLAISAQFQRRRLVINHPGFYSERPGFETRHATQCLQTTLDILTGVFRSGSQLQPPLGFCGPLTQHAKTSRIYDGCQIESLSVTRKTPATNMAVPPRTQCTHYQEKTNCCHVLHISKWQQEIIYCLLSHSWLARFNLKYLQMAFPILRNVTKNSCLGAVTRRCCRFITIRFHGKTCALECN
jgi:hypothetical protein